MLGVQIVSISSTSELLRLFILASIIYSEKCSLVFAKFCIFFLSRFVQLIWLRRVCVQGCEGCWSDFNCCEGKRFGLCCYPEKGPCKCSVFFPSCDRA
jgi:hypothetical protein